ncbi:MAG: Sapep family Mn(2+)-dependent dipeptidase [Clostridia bacterium]|nr:Sapep family Mn(2+)-dependent dipeptidase [Clostridia bacterium]
MKEFSHLIEDLREEFIDIIRRWIMIPSVKADAVPGAPFGPQVRQALDTALADGRRLGFEVRDMDGYAGDIRMGPLGVDPLGILAHLDVVPAGDGWKWNPFGAETSDGRIYGRGASDDKGPAVAALIAMAAVRRAGIPLKREVRLILGCDEETGMEDMAYYDANADLPKTGFSPDATFPVINTEKGLLQVELRGSAAAGSLVVEKIEIGERFNVVPGLGMAIVHGDETLCDRVRQLSGEMKLAVEAEMAGPGLVWILSTGITGHAAYPEAARNAIGQLLLLLRALGTNGMLKTLADCVGMEYDGSGLGVLCRDEISGPLTCNLGILRYDKNGCYATLDIRYPLLANTDRIVACLSAALGAAVSVAVHAHKPPHHVARSSSLVTVLLDAYHEETGRPRECVAIGGGTYARCIQEGVAFGSAFPEDIELAHQADEYLNVDSMMLNARIFANAIVKLAGA